MWLKAEAGTELEYSPETTKIQNFEWYIVATPLKDGYRKIEEKGEENLVKNWLRVIRPEVL